MQNEIERPNTGFDNMQRGYSEDAALAEALKRSKKSSPPVKKDPTRLCNTCEKAYPKKQFDADQWARPHSLCKSCVRQAVRKMDAEQRKIYQNDNTAMAEAMRLSRKAYDMQVNNRVCSVCKTSRAKAQFLGDEWHKSDSTRLCQYCRRQEFKDKIRQDFLKKLAGEDEPEAKNPCHVCYDELHNGKPISSPWACQHDIHRYCGLRWLAENPTGGCPKCREVSQAKVNTKH